MTNWTHKSDKSIFNDHTNYIANMELTGGPLKKYLYARFRERDREKERERGREIETNSGIRATPGPWVRGSVSPPLGLNVGNMIGTSWKFILNTVQSFKL